MTCPIYSIYAASCTPRDGTGPGSTDINWRHRILNLPGGQVIANGAPHMFHGSMEIEVFLVLEEHLLGSPEPRSSFSYCWSELSHIFSVTIFWTLWKLRQIILPYTQIFSSKFAQYLLKNDTYEMIILSHRTFSFISEHSFTIRPQVLSRGFLIITSSTSFKILRGSPLARVNTCVCPLKFLGPVLSLFLSHGRPPLVMDHARSESIL
jgi:hypothetical protein